MGSQYPSHVGLYTVTASTITSTVSFWSYSQLFKTVINNSSIHILFIKLINSANNCHGSRLCSQLKYTSFVLTASLNDEQ